MRVICEKFKDEYIHLNDEVHDICFSLPRLRHAAFTVGAPSLRAAMPTTWHAFAFLLHKIFAIDSVIEIADGQINIPKRYDDLDQSEKGVLSYYLGMAITKIVADEVLHVPWPAHLRAMTKALKITFRSKKRPDLIGLDSNGQWHIIEAKCHQFDPGEKKRKQWVKQVDSIDFIDDDSPKTRSYCFTQLRQDVTIHLVDPDEIKDKKKINLPIKPIQLQKFYYQPYIDIFSTEIQKNDNLKNEILYNPIGFDAFNKIKYSLGIRQDILKDVLRNELVKKSIIPEIKEGYYLGSDGIAIKTEPFTKDDCIEYF